ncbi:DUF2817 domain-containing protein [Pacificimonas sp. WHA3]|uniref:DUF2817 domain-containing protein n=1 Tax=Pacificimonas pallii TaxID=2827236 RepID=A0ABS6SG37_9SPHN|nr:DUF2817 domain-containing protein [Pacificimonas pallii]MBV7257382.1 DUF2817 domain-containing protein [Pacificimonas pallii]
MTFIDDFFDSRSAYLAAAEAGGWRSELLPISAKGPAGEPLSIACTSYGAERPKRALIILSGVHGVEGPAGASIQLGLVESGSLVSSLQSPDDGILLIHAVNPFGWAWGRRQNEDNIDLNRNFQNFEPMPETSADYAALDPVINPVAMTDETTQRLLRTAAELTETKGAAWLQKTIIEGQYEFPKGLNYGGDRPAEANSAIRAIAETYLAGCAEGLIVDLHTGLGAFGEATILSGEAAGTANHEWICGHFPGFEVEAIYGETDSEMTATRGKLARAVAGCAPGSAMRSFTLEFGTYEKNRVFLAGFRENWLHHHGDRSSAQGQQITAEMREVYAPADQSWRDRVIARGIACVETAAEALF